MGTVLYSRRDRTRTTEEQSSSRTKAGWRSEFRRDYGRIVHSASFRRLQGKTQLFPGIESDFFRNRLSHSIEVAQIARSIAQKANHSNDYFKNNNIDLDLVELAALAHDLGHPPFGHNGESALDAKMAEFGGFEGNAQTLRIVLRLEKKKLRQNAPVGAHSCGVDERGIDYRVGLNLTARAIASLLKYDEKIPSTRHSGADLVKGYYASDEAAIQEVKDRVSSKTVGLGKFKTIECQIMDIADDIAYSTYDLEDAFKAGFICPMRLLSSRISRFTAVARKVSEELNESITEDNVLEFLVELFADLLPDATGSPLETATALYKASERVTSTGFARTAFSSALVGEFIRGVIFKVDKKNPALSKAILKRKIKRKVAILKRLNYELLIKSPMLKVAEHRGFDIVQTIFDRISSSSDHQLLPDDFREIHARISDETGRNRVICDFISGMTDRYAVEFYGRLTSENAQTIFKPI